MNKNNKKIAKNYIGKYYAGKNYKKTIFLLQFAILPLLLSGCNTELNYQRPEIKLPLKSEIYINEQNNGIEHHNPEKILSTTSTNKKEILALNSNIKNNSTSHSQKENIPNHPNITNNSLEKQQEHETITVSPDAFFSPTWWENFSDPKLNILINKGLKNNQDLMIAKHNLDQAKALGDITRANLMPSFDIQATLARGNNNKTTENALNDSTLNLYLNYQLDLWGKLNSANKAAQIRILQQQEAKKAVEITLTTSIASTYFELLAANKIYLQKNHNLTAQQALLSLIQHQFDQGSVSNSELNLAQGMFFQAQVEVKQAANQRQQLISKLAVLLGEDPAQIIDLRDFAEEYNFLQENKAMNNLAERLIDYDQKNSEKNNSYNKKIENKNKILNILQDNKKNQDNYWNNLNKNEKNAPNVKLDPNKKENYIAFDYQNQIADDEKNPENLQSIFAANFVSIPNLPEAIPSNLLERRPDIRAAEKDLIASYADVNKARAEFFPDMSISTALGSTNSQFAKAFSMMKNQWGMAASLVGNIFNFGKNNAFLRASIIEKEKKIVEYQKIVIISFAELADSITEYKNAKDSLSEIRNIHTKQINNLHLEAKRYRSGATSLQSFIAEVQKTLQSQEKLVMAEKNLQRAILNTIKTVGVG